MEPLKKVIFRVNSPFDKPEARTRWKWMTGAAAASAAATGVHAEIVQITQANNFVSSSAKDLNSDFTGDGNSDATLSGSGKPISDESIYSGRRYITNGNAATLSVNAKSAGSALAYIESIRTTASDSFVGSRTTFRALAGSSILYVKASGTVAQAINGLFPLSFSDARINAGATTSGFLDIRAINTNFTNHTVQIARLVFDDRNASAPVGVAAGGSNTEWVAPPAPSVATSNAALATSFTNKIKKLKKQLKKAKSSGNSAKAKKIKKKIKKFSKKLKAL